MPFAAFLFVLVAGVVQPEQVASPPTDNPSNNQTTIPAPVNPRAALVESIGKTLRRRAFVPGVDFSTWDEISRPQLESLASASDRDFVRSVNRLLASYKVSHLRLEAPQKAPADKPAAEKVSADPERARPQSRSQPEPASPEPAKAPSPKSTNATLTWPREDAALLKLRSFDSDVYDKGQIESFFGEARGKAKYLVIDLRGNGGGAVDALSHFLAQLLPESTAVGVYVNRDMASRYQRATGAETSNPVDIAAWSERKYRIRRGSGTPFEGKIAVLISRGSASASEIVAAALRDHANALLVGQPTAGKVLMSIHANLPDGYKLQLPTSDYVTSRGVRLEGQPIRPHVSISTGRRQPDRVVDEALAVLVDGL